MKQKNTVYNVVVFVIVLFVFSFYPHPLPTSDRATIEIRTPNAPAVDFPLEESDVALLQQCISSLRYSCNPFSFTPTSFPADECLLIWIEPTETPYFSPFWLYVLPYGDTYNNQKPYVMYQNGSKSYHIVNGDALIHLLKSTEIPALSIFNALNSGK